MLGTACANYQFEFEGSTGWTENLEEEKLDLFTVLPG